jgi:hypothetical protein
MKKHEASAEAKRRFIASAPLRFYAEMPDGSRQPLRGLEAFLDELEAAQTRDQQRTVLLAFSAHVRHLESQGRTP